MPHPRGQPGHRLVTMEQGKGNRSECLETLTRDPEPEKRLHSQIPEVLDEKHQTTGDIEIGGRAYATPREANREEHRATGITVTGRAHATLQEADQEKNTQDRRNKLERAKLRLSQGIPEATMNYYDRF